MAKEGKRFSKKKSILATVKDTLAKREDERDPRSRVGRGGRQRARDAMDYVDSAQTGRKRRNQSTDSNN